MLLRRITQHVKDQNWFAVVVDFLIVVFGVFFGLQVQNWAEEQQRKQFEVAYIERLHDEVVELQGTRSAMIEGRQQTRLQLQGVTELLFEKASNEITASQCLSITEVIYVSNPTDTLPSLEALQESGQLSEIRNTGVSRALQRFLLVRDRARDSRAGIVTAVINLPRVYPQLIKVLEPATLDQNESGWSLATGGAFECDLAGMRENQGFLNDFEATQLNHGFHVRDNEFVSNSLTELHQVLDDHLDITH